MSPGHLSVSSSRITSAKVVGIADMLGSAELDGLKDGDWVTVGGELRMLDGFGDGITEVLGEALGLVDVIVDG